MWSLYTLASFCLLFAAHSATAAPAAEAPCKPPLKFEGKMSAIQGQTFGKSPAQGLLLEGTIHSDMSNTAKPRAAAVENVYISGVTLKVRAIDVFEEKLIYVVDDKAKTCQKLPMPGPKYVSMDPLKNATFQGTEVLGGFGGNSLEVNVFTLAASGFFYKTYFTKDKCAPVSSFLMSPGETWKMVQGLIYSNLKEGVQDPSVFTIPDFCKKSNATPKDNRVLKNGDSEVTEEVVTRHRMRRAIWA